MALSKNLGVNQRFFWKWQSSFRSYTWAFVGWEATRTCPSFEGPPAPCNPVTQAKEKEQEGQNKEGEHLQQIPFGLVARWRYRWGFFSLIAEIQTKNSEFRKNKESLNMPTTICIRLYIYVHISKHIYLHTQIYHIDTRYVHCNRSTHQSLHIPRPKTNRGTGKLHRGKVPNHTVEQWPPAVNYQPRHGPSQYTAVCSTRSEFLPIKWCRMSIHQKQFLIYASLWVLMMFDDVCVYTYFIYINMYISSPPPPPHPLSPKNKSQLHCYKAPNIDLRWPDQADQKITGEPRCFF